MCRTGGGKGGGGDTFSGGVNLCWGGKLPERPSMYETPKDNFNVALKLKQKLESRPGQIYSAT